MSDVQVFPIERHVIRQFPDVFAKSQHCVDCVVRGICLGQKKQLIFVLLIFVLCAFCVHFFTDINLTLVLSGLNLKCGDVLVQGLVLCIELIETELCLKVRLWVLKFEMIGEVRLQIILSEV